MYRFIESRSNGAHMQRAFWEASSQHIDNTTRHEHSPLQSAPKQSVYRYTCAKQHPLPLNNGHPRRIQMQDSGFEIASGLQSICVNPYLAENQLVSRPARTIPHVVQPISCHLDHAVTMHLGTVRSPAARLRPQISRISHVVLVQFLSPTGC